MITKFANSIKKVNHKERTTKENLKKSWSGLKKNGVGETPSKKNTRKIVIQYGKMLAFKGKNMAKKINFIMFIDL